MTGSRFPILRIGWRPALESIRAKTHVLLKYSDGHAELITAKRRKNDGRAGYAESFLTSRSVELLEIALAEQELG